MKNELNAKEGYVFAKADKSAVYGSIMYLGINDKADNYIQITEAEAKKINEQLEANAMSGTDTKTNDKDTKTKNE